MGLCAVQPATHLIAVEGDPMTTPLDSSYTRSFPHNLEPCPLCGELKRKQSALCRTCHLVQRFPLRQAIDQPSNIEIRHVPVSRVDFAVVDSSDYQAVSEVRWTVSHGYARRCTSDKTLMHRFILKAPRGMVVDHINHNTLDNRRENLRVCTRGENQRNMMIGKHNKSGFKGVHFDKRTKRWVAQIFFNNKIKYLGRFNSPQDAAQAYDKSALLIHGDFALTNSIIFSENRTTLELPVT